MYRFTGCIFAAFLVLLCSVKSFAWQGYGDGDNRKVFEGSVFAGVNFTQIDGDTYFGYHKAGLNIGGEVYVHFTKHLGASMDLMYTQKGSRGEAVVESPYVGTYVTKYFMNVNYLEVPVTVHVQYYKVDAEAGASYAVLVGSDEWIQSDQPVTIDPDKHRFNSTDIEYVFGLRREVYKNLQASVRFAYSQRTIRKPEQVPAGYGYGGLGQFNNLFSVRLLYVF